MANQGQKIELHVCLLSLAVRLLDEPLVKSRLQLKCSSADSDTEMAAFK